MTHIKNGDKMTRMKYNPERMQECQKAYQHSGIFNQYTGENNWKVSIEARTNAGGDRRDVNADDSLLQKPMKLGDILKRAYPNGEIDNNGHFGILGDYVVHPECFNFGCNRCSDTVATEEDYRKFEQISKHLDRELREK